MTNSIWGQVQLIRRIPDCIQPGETWPNRVPANYSFSLPSIGLAYALPELPSFLRRLTVLAGKTVFRTGYSISGVTEWPYSATSGATIPAVRPTSRWIPIATNLPFQKATCDSKGNFGFFNLPAGEYRVAVDPANLPENFALVSPGEVKTTITNESPGTARFAIEKHEPKLPVRKVFGGQTGPVR